MGWDEYFIEHSKLVARKSKDKHTKVGCVIVGPKNEVRSTGYNNLPRGANDSIQERYERPEKYFFFEHSEINAICNAARVGIPLEGCRIYITMFPCINCARAIIQAGIVEITAPVPNLESDQWGEGFKRALRLFQELGIKMNYIGER